jgi:hypothetical protein
MKLTGRLYDRNGDAFKGGWVRVKENDTDVVATIFEDENLEDPASNPVRVSDSGGYYDIYVKPGEYKIQVGDRKSTGSQVQTETDLLLGGIAIEGTDHEHVAHGGPTGGAASVLTTTDGVWTTVGGFMSGFEESSKHWTYATPDPRIIYDADPFFQSATDAALFIFRATGYAYDYSGGTRPDYIDIGFSWNGFDPTRWTTVACRNTAGGNNEAVPFYHVDVIGVGKGDVVRLQRRTHGGTRSAVSNVWGAE